MSLKPAPFAVLALTFATTLLATVTLAQSPPLDPPAYYALRTQALGLQNSGDLPGAATAYQRMTRTYGGDGSIWWELGECRRESGQPLEAAEAYRHAFDLGFLTRARVAIEIARCFARASRSDSAIAWIERANALGYERRSELAEEQDFAALRSNAAFRRAAGLLPEREWSREDGWRYDLDFLVAEVKRLHYRYRSAPLPAGFEPAVRKLREQIPQKSDAGVMVEMQRLMAMLGDGHTTLHPAPGARVKLLAVPLQFQVFADGLYVVDAPADLSRWIGARIERVGSVTAEEALGRIEPLVPRDNDMGPRGFAPLFLPLTTLLAELGIAAEPGNLALSGVAPDGSRIEGSVAAAESRTFGPPPKLPAARFANAPEAPPSLRRVSEPYWFEALPGDSIVTFQFNQVMDAGNAGHGHGSSPSGVSTETLRAFALRLRRYCDEHPVRVLIVDVRHNNGGNGELLTTLVRTLVHYETTRPGRRLFVITSPYTFSAAQVFIATLDRLTNAVFVGEPSGSCPNFVGEDTPLLLPWSQIRGSLSARIHASSSADERVWIAPEIPVAATGADWRAGRDAAMDAVLRTVGANR